MIGMPWYHDAEKKLANSGKWVIGSALGLIAGVSIYFMIEVVVYDRKAIPASAWIVYMLAP